MLISVYITTKNRLPLVKRAVQSIVGQSYKHIELIIVNDGSTDGTREYLNDLAMSHNFIKVINNDRSLGAPASRNRAIEVAGGTYITGCDDDDFFLEDRLESFVAALTQDKFNQAAALYSDFVVLNKFGKRNVNLPDCVDVFEISKANKVGCQIFIRLECLRAIGGFDLDMPAWQDFELWYRIIIAYGAMMKVTGATYCVDESHEFERISAGKNERVLKAYKIFCKKHFDTLAERDRFFLYLNYLAYPQVKVSVFHFIEAARFRCLSTLAKVVVAKLFRYRNWGRVR